MLESLEKYLGILIQDIKPTQKEVNNSFLVQNLSKINYFYISKNIEIEDFNSQNRLKMAEEFRNSTFFINNPFESMWVELSNPVEIVDKRLVMKSFGIFEQNEILEIHVLLQLDDGRMLPFNMKFDWNGGIGYQAFNIYKFPIHEKEFFMECEGEFLCAIRQIIDNINNRDLHYINNDENIKIRGRVGGVFPKFKYNPDHIIYVATEKTVKTNENIAKRLIKKPDFAYEVMGHWRRLFGKSHLGKNRQGTYCVVGRTWVKEHVRGQGELKKRTRLVVERV